jgi:S-(hydroxymethyl)glutathione dehydrogenase/alcohol dehydrogenase
MTTMNAAVFRAVDAPMGIEQVGLADPGYGQVLVKTAAAGVCHSDLHFLAGSWPMRLPAVLGHEAAGVVERTGKGVTYVQPGDHVILLFVASAGSAATATPAARTPPEAPARAHLTIDGRKRRCSRSPPSPSTWWCLRMPSRIRPRCRSIGVIGCAVMTGVGAAINTARVAQAAPALSSDAAASASTSSGLRARGAGRSPSTCSQQAGDGETLAPRTSSTSSTDALAVCAIRPKAAPTTRSRLSLPRPSPGVNMAAGGEAVIVGMAPFRSEATISATDFLSEKVLRGCMYGSTRPRVDMPRIVDLYLSGRIKLDELVTRRLPLAGINEAFDAMKNGEVARSVLVF